MGKPPGVQHTVCPGWRVVQKLGLLELYCCNLSTVTPPGHLLANIEQSLSDDWTSICLHGGGTAVAAKEPVIKKEVAVSTARALNWTIFVIINEIDSHLGCEKLQVSD